MFSESNAPLREEGVKAYCRYEKSTTRRHITASSFMWSCLVELNSFDRCVGKRARVYVNQREEMLNNTQTHTHIDH